MESAPDEAEPAASAEPALRGSVLDVLRTPLDDHQERDTVLSIVGKLGARNTASVIRDLVAEEVSHFASRGRRHYIRSVVRRSPAALVTR